MGILFASVWKHSKKNNLFCESSSDIDYKNENTLFIDASYKPANIFSIKDARTSAVFERGETNEAISF